jgi:hypothetical protein
MRVLRGITRPLAGEHIFAVTPEPASQVETGWHKHLNLYSGRALSARALQAEQARRAGGLCSRGQVHSPGVVSGLEVTHERLASGTVFRISAGLGLTAGGEDIKVTSETRLDPFELRVVAPVSLLAGIPAEPGERPPEPDDDPSRREVGPRLERFVPRVGEAPPAVNLPRAGILVLQPVTVELPGFEAQEDICASGDCGDGLSDASFEDWQLVDGCRLLHFVWPEDVLDSSQPEVALPAEGDPARQTAIGLWRNRLAYTIFAAEGRWPAGENMPWDDFGVAVGLVGFDTDWNLLFVDRNSVVRLGGRPRRRSGYHRPAQVAAARYTGLPAAITSAFPIRRFPRTENTALPVENDPFLWQARMLQFSEQVGDALAAGLRPEDLDKQFRFTPPAGMLPRDVLQFALGDPTAADRVSLGRFFPASFTMEAAPAPLEQLDAAFEASASLTPFDMSSPDRVRFLVPVPQAFYDPALLKVEAVDPAFSTRIQELVTGRNKVLRRRQDVRERQAALYRAVRGEDLPAVPPGPGAAEDERPDPASPEPPEDDFGTILLNGTRVTFAFERLKEQLSVSTPIKKETVAPFPTLAADLENKIKANEAKISEITQGRMRFTPDPRDAKIKRFELRGVLNKAQTEGLLALETAQPFQDAINRLFLFSQKDDLSRLDELGIERFIEFLQSKVDQADDQVNIGFVRVQTDTYRMLQLMRGVTDATRLATSPVLASIARGESAAATKEDLVKFYDELKKRTVEPPPEGEPEPPPEGEPEPVEEGRRRVSRNPGIFSARNLLDRSERAFRFPPGSVAGESERVSTDVQFGTGGLSSNAQSEILRVLSGRAGAAGQLGTVGEAGPIPAKESDVIEQTPLVGATITRTLNIAERLAAPRAPEAKQFATSSKFDVIRSMMNLDLSVEGLEVSGLPEYQGTEAQYDDFGQPKRIGPVPIEDLDPNDVLLEPNPTLNDESAYFVGAVELADHTIATLRTLEGRVAGYRRAIELCKAALAELRSQQRKSESRLQELNATLLVARHDVALARALLGDESKRVAEVNGRRDSILRESVRFVAFYRPRSTANVRSAPVRTLFPGQVEPSVPACLESNVTTPPDLQRMVDLFRGAPLDWFTHIPRLLHMLDRLDDLQNLLQSSFSNLTALTQIQTRNGTAPSAMAFQAASAQTTQADLTPGMLQTSISKVFQAQMSSLSSARAEIASLDLSSVLRGSWKDARQAAGQALTLGDLIEGRHARSDLRNFAIRELDQIDSIATCLYAAFSRVRPVLRMAWALELSQYDQAIDLRNLGRLARWGEVEYLERRAMQELVEWLYSRIEAGNAQALGMMNDLVRVCLLEASHAPVRGILSGYLPRDMQIHPGILIGLKAYDLAQVRMGMQVKFFRGEEVVAEANVEDLNTEGPAVRVTSVKAVDTTGQPLQQVNLASGARVHFLG